MIDRIERALAISLSGALAAAALAAGPLPVAFEENRGQAPGHVRFLARASGLTLLVHADGSSTLVPAVGGEAVRLCLESATTSRVEVCGDGRSTGVVSYLRGRDPARWVRGAPRFERVLCRNAGPGVDLIYHVRRGVLELDVALAAGVDPARIVLAISGARSARVTAAAALEVETWTGVFALGLPLTHQLADACAAQPVASAYHLLSPPGADPVRVGFSLGAHACDRPIVIDPVLGYSSYLGGSTLDEAFAVALDAAGNVYVGGQTTSLDFPLQSPVQPMPGGMTPEDAFVAKLDPTGSTLLFATYLGGSDTDTLLGLDVDAAGSAVLTGWTNSADFPLAAALQPSLDGFRDAFVARLNVAGTALDYSTYLGGPGIDEGHGIAVRTGGSAVVVGNTAGGFPTVAAVQPTFGGVIDGFICEVNAAGSGLTYSTYLGGSGGDFLLDLAPVAGGDLFVCGHTNSTDLPTVAPFQPALGGGSQDAWLARVAAGGGAVVYSTYLGGNDFDSALGVDVDAAGCAHVVGRTSSVDFPTQAAFQPVKAGPAIEADAFLTRFDATGSALVWSTFMGGVAFDSADGVAVDPAGNTLVTGGTDSPDFPLVAPLQPSLSGPRDSFALKLSSSGATLFYSTFYGGGLVDAGASLVTDATGRAHIVGFSISDDFPVARPFQPNTGGGRDAIFYSIDDRRACGDCDLDGSINILDSLAAAQHAVTLTVLTGDGFSNCNVRGDLEPAPGAEVSVLDSLAIAQYAAGLPVALTCL